MPNELVNLRVKEVSVVDKAANGKTFLIMKRTDQELPLVKGGEKKLRKFKDVMKSFFMGNVDDDDNGQGPKDFNTVLAEQKAREEDWRNDSILYDLTSTLWTSLDSILDDEALEIKSAAIAQTLQQFFIAVLDSYGIEKAGKKISASRLDTLKQMHSNLGELLAGVDDTVINDDNELQKKGEDQMAADHVKGCQCEKCLKVAKSLEVPAIDAAVQKRMDEIEKDNVEIKKRNDALEMQIKKQADEMANAQYIAKAADLKGIAADPSELGLIMKSLAEKDPDNYAKVEAVLKAANEAIVKSALFSEKGRGGDGDATIAKRVEAMADEIRKSDTKLTKAQAVSKVYRDNPALYADYQKELRGAK